MINNEVNSIVRDSFERCFTLYKYLSNSFEMYFFFTLRSLKSLQYC